MKLNKVYIAVTDLDKAKVFYADILGFELINESQKELEFKVGRSILNLIEYQTNALYHFAFEIPINLLESAAAWLQDRDIQLILPDEEKSVFIDIEIWNARSIYFYDP
ncbi:hypothetical protein GNY06_01075 [Elizabethkingia argentiflava]|uniref:VOC domain-containing protein n=1 Tax=Elizabethkingia argenteiflava TaxID=2681556 RepID=A0A845PVA8_9FLAO|nr:VOC family protein [Elizabethkingia argenteiflava]NAW50040.1 hypothetical protein [Elizabethkingia argenteiflava]